MNYLVSGYFGFRNAGDEAVLAAMLGHLALADPEAHVTATSGDPQGTTAQHGCAAVSREKGKELLAAIRASQVFISGGGSLLQDVTSLRNVVYYTGLVRMARLLRKPVMMYAQGVGPLNKPLSQKLARAAFTSASLATVRDPDSLQLLRSIGVRREVEVTADPVWDLAPQGYPLPGSGYWMVALRSWPGSEVGFLARLVNRLREAAESSGVKLRFLPMQPGRDHEVLHGLCSYSELVDTTGKSPGEILTLASSGSMMVAMRLHALIFAASQGLPVVALNYDPKVASLAAMLGAPVVQAATAESLETLPAALCTAAPGHTELLLELKRKARRNAELACSLGPAARHRSSK